jgi:hypothetical protein
MQRYTRLKAEATENDVGLSLVVDAELFRLEGVIRWLDAAEARLSNLPHGGAGSDQDGMVVRSRAGRR